MWHQIKFLKNRKRQSAFVNGSENEERKAYHLKMVKSMILPRHQCLRGNVFFDIFPIQDFPIEKC